MSTGIVSYTAPPSALRYMLRAFLPPRRWHADQGFPDLRVAWRDFRIDTRALGRIDRAAGTDPPLATGRMALIAPHVIGFRLVMAMLTHPAWPLPIWSALQVRNRLVLHRPLRAGEESMLTVRVTGWRVLEKGLEVDLQTWLGQSGTCAWESVVTFYYRGRFGLTAEHGIAHGAGSLAPTVDEHQVKLESWCINGRNRWTFGALTGDYNGLHQWDWYARRFGFRAAFAHPQRVTAQCLAHLQGPDTDAQQLDVWIKGQAFYGAEVALLQSRQAADGGVHFALYVADDARPALIGSWRHAISA
jgi:hypothetical protein